VEVRRCVLPDVGFRTSCPGKKDCSCGCLRALDPFCVIVRHGRVFSRPEQNLIQRFERKPNRTDSHRGAIAPAIVGLGFGGLRPSVKKTSVPCVWITLIVGFHKGNIVGAGQERFGQGNGEDCIVGKAAIRTEQIELLGLDVVPLVNRADNVTRYCTDHLELPRKRPCHVENALDCLGIILGGRQLVILIATFEIRIRFAYVSDQ
jgi:hypothetical protein